MTVSPTARPAELLRAGGRGPIGQVESELLRQLGHLPLLGWFVTQQPERPTNHLPREIVRGGQTSGHHRQMSATYPPFSSEKEIRWGLIGWLWPRARTRSSAAFGDRKLIPPKTPSSPSQSASASRSALGSEVGSSHTTDGELPIVETVSTAAAVMPGHGGGPISRRRHSAVRLPVCQNGRELMLRLMQHRVAQWLCSMSSRTLVNADGVIESTRMRSTDAAE